MINSESLPPFHSLFEASGGRLTIRSRVDRLDQLSSDLDSDALNAWTLERNTWQLVQALYS